MRTLFAIRYSLFALLLAAASNAYAQSWPQRPVKLLVPFAAGGNIDVMGRLAASRLSEAFGQQFVVENRVGGNGAIATEAVARAAADGHTLLWSSTSVVAIFPAITKVGYDPVKDFAPVSLFSVAQQVLIVNPKFPAASVAEFVAYVKSQKEKLAYAGGGGPRQRQQSHHVDLPQARGPRNDQCQLSRHRACPDRRPHPDHVRSDLGGAAAGPRRSHPHAGGIERHPLARGARRAGVGRARLSRVPHGVVDRPDGARRHAEGDRRADGGRARARPQGSAIRRAHPEGRRRARCRCEPRRFCGLHRPGDRALGRGGEDRRGDPAISHRPDISQNFFVVLISELPTYHA